MFIITYCRSFGVGETIEEALGMLEEDQGEEVHSDMCDIYEGKEVDVVKTVTYTVTTPI